MDAVSRVHAIRDHAIKQENEHLGLPDRPQAGDDKVEKFGEWLWRQRSREGRTVLELLNVSVRANRLARLCRMPPMRQQLCNLTRPLRRQPCQHILEIGIRIVPIITGRLDQTHDRSSALEHAIPRRAFEKATG